MPPRARATSAAPLGAPLFLLNLKSYPGAVGTGALRIGRALERAARRAGVAAAIAPAPADVATLAHRLRIPVLSQHADGVEAGPYTGSIVPEALRASGARGSLVNHSERRLSSDQVRSALRRLNENGLVPVVCAQSVPDARRLARFAPPYLAVEPPELIGGTRSVSTARPEVVAETVAAVRAVSPRTIVLCGAGIHDARDVRRALELGSRGVLVASAVARAASPSAALRSLLRGFG